jgi:hypothetical protein
LSVEAVHDNAILDCVVEPTANPDGADGSVVSEQALVEAVTVVRDDTFPAASNASTPNV